ncbi:T9SS type A sorting domain-containing protein [Flexithrix dorotheae]|uniref:T9SS type A sorting domain-containing protein n=1 Tax=Flexithrix dorotheae TaxID=70993 RepID=UPI0003657FF8|nr:T9SS type A sorting domain-containing protein [Flexithrix dorotheae]
MEYDQHMREKYPSLGSMDGFESWMQHEIRRKQLKRTSAEDQTVFVIPVIVHVIYNDENVGEGTNLPADQITSQFLVLNEDFRRKNGDRLNTPAMFQQAATDMKIEFRPALVDPDGNVLAEPGIHRYNGKKDRWSENSIDNEIKSKTSWDPTRYMNIWVADMGPSTLGYSTWPKNSGNPGVPFEGGTDDKDGVVINSRVFGSNYTELGEFDYIQDNRYDKGRTCTHEIGHFFAILHPWGVNGGCSDDDYCEDTPATSSNRDDVASPCEFPDPKKPNTCIEEENDLPDMFQNFMDYTADACMNLFTHNQRERAVVVLQNSPNRKELLASSVIKPHFAPSQLEVTENLTAGYDLTWNDNSLNETKFIVERSASKNSGYTKIGETSSNVTTYLDNPGNGIFYYRIVAENPVGRSAYSTIQSTPNLPLPTAPANLSATTISQNEIKLSWDLADLNATGVEVEVSEGNNNNFEKLSVETVPSGQTTYAVESLNDNQVYYFRVNAKNGTGNSPYSNETSAATFPYQPEGPENLQVIFDKLNRHFYLTWNDQSDKEERFIIERSTDSLENFEEVDSVIENEIEFLDETFSPPPLSVFYYRVRAQNIGGNSPYSNIAKFDAVTGIEGAAEMTDFTLNVFPNPARGVIYIEFKNFDIPQKVRIELTDLAGKIYTNEEITISDSQLNFPFDLTGFSNGLYIISVSNEDLKSFKKIIIQN